MVIHFMKVAYRNAFRSKLFTFVNVAGLSLGIAASFLLFVHVRQELNYEAHVPGKELVYRVSSVKWAKVSPMLAPMMNQDLEEAKLIGRLAPFNNATLQTDGATAFSGYVYFADPSILKVFDIQFVKGNAATALDDINSVVVTESIAARLFTAGDDPIGKAIMINGGNLTVSGVMKDQPRSTHLKIDCMLSIRQSSAHNSTLKTWRGVATYVRFVNATEAANLQEKLQPFVYKFFEGTKTKDEVERDEEFIELEPIASIHLNSHKEKEAEANSDMMYIYIFSTFGILIMLIASINFINLFTAQALRRLKEVGVRKAIGAGKGQLILQFLGESFFMVTISAIVGVLMAGAALPWYNSIASIPISIATLLLPQHLTLLGMLVVLTGLVSGAYPAVAVASRSAILNSGGSSSFGHVTSVRKGLVGMQFIVSMFLMIAAVVVFSQLRYIQSNDLGFAKDQVIAVKLYGRLWLEATNHRDAIRDALLTNKNVHEVSLTDRIVGERFGFEGVKIVDSPDDAIDTRHVFVDERYLQTMGIELIEGNNFDGKPDTIPQFILNESAARIAHIDNLVGRAAINVAGSRTPGRIVGVVKDFNFASLHSAVDPLVLEFTTQSVDYLLVRIDPNDIQGALQHVELTLKKLVPGTIVSYAFLDDSLQSLYFRDYSLFRTTRIFSVVTVIIAVLGLFALAAQAAESRTKEVGIRKVLGASATQVVGLLSRDFLVILTLSLLIAIPAAWYASSSWLTGFNYRIQLHWAMFALPVVFIGLIAMVAVWAQSVRVATRNPVKSLKYE